MSLAVSHMPHAYYLYEDFLTLDHWYEWGANDRDYMLRPDASIGTGNALWMEDTGVLRVARDTDIPVGETVQISWWAFRHDTSGACTLQLRNLAGAGGGVLNLMGNGSNLLSTGWNRCVTQVTVPADWSGARFSLYSSATVPGGMIAQLRAAPEPAEGTG